MKVDYLIVGQGLAGSLLAGLLLERDRHVLVIDDGHRTAASRAAAGIINPITGKRLSRSGLIDALLADAFDIYPRLERMLGTRFFDRRSVRRILVSPEEAQYWARRRNLEEYRRHLEPLEAPEPLPDVTAPFGAFVIRTAAQLDVPVFLQAVRERLIARDGLREVPFDYERVEPCPGCVRWRDIQASRLIFCEGYRLKQNPFFNRIELNPAKGEVLTLAAPGFQTDEILQGNKWLFRNRAGEVLAGTTYHWDRLDETVSAAARTEIRQGLSRFFSGRYEITGQRAGVRPVTRADNRPLVGLHRQYESLAILNGLGSKGALQGPFAARQLMAKMEDNQMICSEINVCRESLWRRRRSA